MTITATGRRLRDELNEALGAENGGTYIPLRLLDDLSLLARRAKRYATRQEQHCTYESACGEKWERDEERLEASIRLMLLEIPGVTGVTFQGDPRGYTVLLHLKNGATNTWGNNGWGIA